jgi:UDP-N-acetylmuramyl pentapeptide synthase
MNELGQYEQSAHEQIGLEIKKLGIKNLFCFGPATKFTITATGLGQYFESTDQLASALKKFLKPEHIVLIKASRAHHFEDIVAALTA